MNKSAFHFPDIIGRAPKIPTSFLFLQKKIFTADSIPKSCRKTKKNVRIFHGVEIIFSDLYIIKVFSYLISLLLPGGSKNSYSIRNKSYIIQAYLFVPFQWYDNRVFCNSVCLEQREQKSLKAISSFR